MKNRIHALATENKKQSIYISESNIFVVVVSEFQ